MAGQDANPAGVGRDALRTALAEFRVQLDRLFDAQRGWLLGHDVTADLWPGEPAPAAPAASRRHSVVLGPSAGPAPRAAAPAMPRPWLQDDAPGFEPGPRRGEAPEPPAAGGAGPEPSDDPRQRLDALAKMLNNRLRQATPAASEGGT